MRRFIIFLLLSFTFSLLTFCSRPQKSVMLINEMTACSIVTDLGDYVSVNEAVQSYKNINWEKDNKEARVCVNALAAQELQTHLCKIFSLNSLELPIIDDNDKVNGPVIMLGVPGEDSPYKSIRKKCLKYLKKSKNMTDQSFRFDTLTEEEQAFLVISGKSHHAVLYGVYEMLDRLGVRWISPSPSTTTIPSQSLLIWSPENSIYTPSFTMRGFIANDVYMYLQDQLVEEENLIPFYKWMTRNRLNIVWQTFPNLTPYLKQRGIHTIAQLEFTQNDSSHFDSTRIENPINTLKPEQAPADFYLFDISQFKKISTDNGLRISQEIQKRLNHPVILTNSQNHLHTPIQPFANDSIYVMLMPHERCYNHPICDPSCTTVNEEICREINDWTHSKSPFKGRVLVNELYNNKYFNDLPTVFSTMIGQDVKAYKSAKIDGLTYYNPHFHQSGVHQVTAYQFARQTWNTQLPTNTIIAEYLRTIYGDVGDKAFNYFTRLEVALANISAWKIAIAQKLNTIVLEDNWEPLLPLENFKDHFIMAPEEETEIACIDWEKTYGYTYELQYILHDMQQTTIKPELLSKINELENQTEYLLLTVRLYDNILRIFLPDTEPAMIEEAKIRLVDLVPQLETFMIGSPTMGQYTALEASGIQEAVQKLVNNYKSESN